MKENNISTSGIEPENLGIKIGSKKEKFLADVREKMAEEKEACEFTAEMDKAFLEVIDKMIKKETEKFK